MNPYGFDWGPMHVERLAHIEGRGYALRVYTDHMEVQVFVTEKGRKVKAYPPRPTALIAPEPASAQSANMPQTPPLGETRNTTGDPQ